MSVLGLIAMRGGGATSLPGGNITGASGNQPTSGSMAAGGGKFVAYSPGLSGVLVSANGDDWKQVTAVGTLVHLTYLNSRFIGWNDGSLPLRVSTDGGDTWSTINPVGGPASGGFTDITWDGAKYIGVNSLSLGYTDGVWTSTDLTNWTQVSAQGLNTIAHLAGVYVATQTNARAYRSTDLVTWTEVLFPTISGNAAGVRVANGKFILMGGSPENVHSGTDGLAWTSVNIGAPTPMDVAWNGSAYLFDSKGLATNFSSTALATVANSITHQANKTPQAAIYQGRRNMTVVDGTRFIVALGGGDFAYSTDNGATWTYRYKETPYAFQAGTTTGTGYGLPEISSAGDVLPITAHANGLLVGLGGCILDGSTKRTSGTTANFRGVAYSGALYVAVGDGGVVYTSADKITWTLAATLGGNLRAVAWDAGLARFVAVGDGGAIYSSANGAAWTARASGTANTLRCVRSVSHATIKFIAVGDNSTLCYSTNATAWTAITINDGFGSISYGAADYGAGVFMLGAARTSALTMRAAEVTDVWVSTFFLPGYIYDIQFQAPGTFHLYGLGRSHQTAT